MKVFLLKLIQTLLRRVFARYQLFTFPSIALLSVVVVAQNDISITPESASVSRQLEPQFHKALGKNDDKIIFWCLRT